MGVLDEGLMRQWEPNYSLRAGNVPHIPAAESEGGGGARRMLFELIISLSRGA